MGCTEVAVGDFLAFYAVVIMDGFVPRDDQGEFPQATRPLDLAPPV